MPDPCEFDQFYLATAPRVLSHLYLITGDMGEAQDCMQEAYSRAWQRWDTLTGGSPHPPLAWVRSVGCRLAISNWRRAKAQARAWTRHGPLPEASAGPSADVVAVRQALAKLPTGQRVVIVLHYFADLRVDDIAAELRIPVGTVKARLSRGRTALAALLDDEPRPAPVKETNHA